MRKTCHGLAKITALFSLLNFFCIAQRKDKILAKWFKLPVTF